MSQWDSARLEAEVQLSHDSLGRDVGFAALVHVTQNDSHFSLPAVSFGRDVSIWSA